MHLLLNCIVVEASAVERQEMVEFLGAQGINVVGQAPTLEALPALLTQGDAANLVIIDLDPEPREALGKVGPLIRQHPAASFLVMSRSLDPEVLMAAIRTGVKEFVALPMREESLKAALGRIAEALGADHRAKVLHFIPTAGGCGCTTIACSAATVLARSGKTVLMDLDLVRGTVATSFDLRPRFSIADLMDLTQKLDRQLLDNALALHVPSGVAVLARPEMPEDAGRVTPGGLNRLLHLLVQLFDYMVVDSLLGMDAVTHTLVRAAQTNVLVMQMTVPAVRNAQRFVSMLRRLGVGDDHIRVVVNRFARRGASIEVGEAEKALGLPIAWTIPNDYRSASEAADFGQPVVLRSPRAEVSRGIAGLPAALNGRK